MEVKAAYFCERGTITDLIFMLFYSNYNTRLQKDTAKDGMVTSMLFVFYLFYAVDLLSCISRVSPGT